MSLPAATDFLMQYYAEAFLQLPATALRARLAELEAQWAQAGTFTLSSEELSYGARVAWRNAARCVGRAYWPALQVRDLRHLSEPAAVFAALQDHLRVAWNGGQIRPVMSIFGSGIEIINDQLIRYAGYHLPPYGDPQNLALTDFLRRCGWTPPATPTPFDVLPLALRTAAGVELFEWCPEDVKEVLLSHDQYPALAELGLRWHALPVISNMQLEVAGQRFGCAPFNGWYLQTEIAARNLADEGRYNLLGAVAAALNQSGAGLDTAHERSLWRDRALLELNIATLQSFDRAGVKIADHHRVSRHFEQFVAREKAAGRAVQGDWSWLIPPLSPALTPQWKRHFAWNKQVSPRFVTVPAAWTSLPKKAAGCPLGHGT